MSSVSSSGASQGPDNSTSVLLVSFASSSTTPSMDWFAPSMSAKSFSSSESSASSSVRCFWISANSLALCACVVCSRALSCDCCWAR